MRIPQQPQELEAGVVGVDPFDESQDQYGLILDEVGGDLEMADRVFEAGLQGRGVAGGTALAASQKL